jgi:hypothetical protein
LYNVDSFAKYVLFMRYYILATVITSRRVKGRINLDDEINYIKL